MCMYMSRTGRFALPRVRVVSPRRRGMLCSGKCCHRGQGTGKRGAHFFFKSSSSLSSPLPRKSLKLSAGPSGVVRARDTELFGYRFSGNPSAGGQADRVPCQPWPLGGRISQILSLIASLTHVGGMPLRFVEQRVVRCRHLGSGGAAKGAGDGLWPLTGAPQAVRATAEAEAGDGAEEGRKGGGGRNITFEPQQREGVHRCDASRRWRRQRWRRGMRRRSARRRNASQCDARRSGTARWISRWRWLYSHLHAKCRCCA